MIIYDFMGHMVSTQDPEELHAFARLLGLKREWFQTPGRGLHHAHYDLTTSNARSRARRMGAVEVDPLSLVKKAWWTKNKHINHKQGGHNSP